MLDLCLVGGWGVAVRLIMKRPSRNMRGAIRSSGTRANEPELAQHESFVERRALGRNSIRSRLLYIPRHAVRVGKLSSSARRVAVVVGCKNFSREEHTTALSASA